jgi:hypothetical protein
MDTFSRVYYLIWSVLAISGGMLILSFRKEFLKRNAHALEYLYKKTHFILFKRQAEKMETGYMLVVSTIVAIGFILLGSFTLIQNIR